MRLTQSPGWRGLPNKIAVPFRWGGGGVKLVIWFCWVCFRIESDHKWSQGGQKKNSIEGLKSRCQKWKHLWGSGACKRGGEGGATGPLGPPSLEGNDL